MTRALPLTLLAPALLLPIPGTAEVLQAENEICDWLFLSDTIADWRFVLVHPGGGLTDPPLGGYAGTVDIAVAYAENDLGLCVDVVVAECTIQIVDGSTGFFHQQYVDGEPSLTVTQADYKGIALGDDYVGCFWGFGDVYAFGGSIELPVAEIRVDGCGHSTGVAIEL